jgi:hypothetical protein
MRQRLGVALALLGAVLTVAGLVVRGFERHVLLLWRRS